MAVNYETGTATGPSDLISKLATFLGSLGWSVSSETTTGSGDTTIPTLVRNVAGKVFSKGALYFGIGYDTDDVFICGNCGSDGSDWANQPGSSILDVNGYVARANEMPGSYVAYHFFNDASPEYVHVVVERSSGIFNHFSFGELQKAGAYTGGAYFDAVTWYSTQWSTIGGVPSYMRRYPEWGGHSYMFDATNSNYLSTYFGGVRADIDGKSNNWMIQRIDGSHGNRSHGDVRQNSFSYPMHIRAPADFNQLAALQPIIVIGDRPSSLYSILGYVPGVRAVNIRNLAPGSTLTIGSADWLIVPAIQKTAVWDSDHSISTDYSSGDYAYAYLLPAA